MDWGVDDNHPSEHIYQHAVIGMQSAAVENPDYTWLEKCLPYSAESENGVHWFVRFK